MRVYWHRLLPFVAESVAIVVIVYLIAMVIEQLWLVNASLDARQFFSAIRGIVAAALVVALASLVIHRRLRESELRRERQRSTDTLHASKERFQRTMEAEIKRERQRADEALRRSEERFRALVEKSPDAFALIDAHGIVQYASPSTGRILGYSPEEVVGHSGFELIHPEDVRSVRQLMADCLARPGVDTPVDWRCRHKDGSWRYLEGVLSNRLAEPGIPGIVVNYRDVTSRKHAEAALRRREQEFSDFCANASVPIHWDGPDGVIIWANQAELDLLGYRRDEYVGHSLAEFHNDRQAAEDLLHRLAAGETLHEYEACLRCKDGSLRHVLISANVLWEEGQFVHTRCFTHDITDRKRAEAALQESEERCRVLVEGVADHAICLLDPTGRVASWNPGAQRILGYQEAEILGENFSCFYPVAEAERGKPNRDLQQAVGEGRFEEEGWRIRQHGWSFWANVVISPLHTAAGNLRGFVAVTRDVTERKQMEEELRQAQKMEAIGQLAGSVAHDFNNLLTAITGYSELLLDLVKTEDRIHQFVTEIKKAGERATVLTRQLLAFSRKQEIALRVLDVNAIIADLDKMLVHLLGPTIELVMNLDPEAGRVKADTGQIEQVLVNLVVNARDAMVSGGRLTITTTPVELDRNYGRAHLDVRPGPYVLLTVTDTGAGMSPEVLARLFEPFFTTKEAGKGTGLGLSTVYGIIRRCGGHLRVQSQPGQGTTFRIYLPRVEDPVEAVPPPAPLPPPPPMAKTVLLVDDEEVIRNMMWLFLQDHGYHVLAAGNGVEALRLANEHGGPIHLLVTDLMMPQLSGTELAQQILAKRPETKVLFMSGYIGKSGTSLDVAAAGFAFLHKPFRLEALLARMHEVLGEQALPAAAG